MEACRNELAAEVLRSAGRPAAAGRRGLEHAPAIRPRDILLIRRCRVESAGVGDIVVFTRDRRLFAHRVISRTHGSSCCCSRCPGLAFTEGNMRGPSIQDCERSHALTGVPSRDLLKKVPPRTPPGTWPIVWMTAKGP